MNIKRLQGDLKVKGLYEGYIDGIWGSMSEAAYLELLGDLPIAWGAKVSKEFKEKLIEVSDYLRVDPSYLMACIAFESGESFSPSIKNAAGSGATGLIQFMPRTAEGLGTSVEELERMSAVQQLDYVKLHFKPFRGRLNTLADVYMTILWPRAVGKPESSALWSSASRPTTYRQNSGLDVNRDGVITKAEAAALVQAKLQRGIQYFLG